MSTMIAPKPKQAKHLKPAVSVVPAKSAVTLCMNCTKCPNPFTITVKVPNVRFPQSGNDKDASFLKVGNELEAELGSKFKRHPFYHALGTLVPQGLESANANNPLELQLDFRITAEMKPLVEGPIKAFIEKHVAPGHTLVVVWTDENKVTPQPAPSGFKPRGVRAGFR